MSSGLLLVDKPGGITSHGMVARARRAGGTRKVGHAGTLDPMATGLLILGMNRATRLLTYIVGVDKAYTATVRLGQSTVTDDAEGELISSPGSDGVRRPDVHGAAAEFRGEIEQVPSAVSAVKIDGQRSYARVRAGEQVEHDPRPVTITSLEIGATHATVAPNGTAVLDVTMTVECSSGTYIRALARDLGKALGCDGHLTQLRRTRVGPFDLAEAIDGHELPAPPPLLSSGAALGRLLPVWELTPAQARAVRFGQHLSPVDPPNLGAAGQAGTLYGAFAPDGQGIAVLRHDGDRIRPVLVLDPA